MTGFGRGVFNHEGGRLIVEIKTINGKQLDVSAVRYPAILRECEPELRQRLSVALVRGKVECSVSYTPDHGAADGSSISTLDPELFHAMVEHVWSVMRREFSVTDGECMLHGGNKANQMEPALLQSKLMAVQSVIRRSEVWRETTQELTPALRSGFFSALEEALDHCVEFRTQEGIATARDLEASLDTIEDLLHQVDGLKDARIERIKQKLTNGLATLPEEQGRTVEPARLAQEMIFYIEKLDINEEIKRLGQHCRYFRQTLHEEIAGQGRKLGFITQEMGREINTIGSKSNDADMQRCVVLMKDHLEKMKEQLLNVL